MEPRLAGGAVGALALATLDGITTRVLRVDADGHLQVDVLSVTGGGDASAANQATEITSLQLIDDLVNALASVATDKLRTSVIDSALPSGAATAANQSTEITALQKIDDLQNALSAVATDQLRVDLVTPFTPTAVYHGKTTVTTAGTRVQLSSQALKAASVKALAANTGKIYVGDSDVASTNGYELSAGDAVDLTIDNLNRLYIDSSVNGEGITWLGVA